MNVLKTLHCKQAESLFSTKISLTPSLSLSTRSMRKWFPLSGPKKNHILLWIYLPCLKNRTMKKQQIWPQVQNWLNIMYCIIFRTSLNGQFQWMIWDFLTNVDKKNDDVVTDNDDDNDRVVLLHSRDFSPPPICRRNPGDPEASHFSLHLVKYKILKYNWPELWWA